MEYLIIYDTEGTIIAQIGKDSLNCRGPIYAVNVPERAMCCKNKYNWRRTYTSLCKLAKNRISKGTGTNWPTHHNTRRCLVRRRYVICHSGRIMYCWRKNKDRIGRLLCKWLKVNSAYKNGRELKQNYRNKINILCTLKPAWL